ncbi:S8 family serine peptidase [Trichloromonas sp.]|uniref:S8 family serine peptidase n=1 Tax=Trichloromonas sp. TaxID=3069249 RepID=UPI002A3A34BE|nr:S8 family serine peptidase [Trichloromonas sp.]
MTTSTLSRPRLSALGFLPLIGAIVLTLTLVFAIDALAVQPNSKRVAGELLVQIHAGAAANAVDGEFKRLGATTAQEIPGIKVKRIRINEANHDKVKAALARNPHVAFVEDNFIAQGLLVPSDTTYPSQWHLPKIAAPQGWDLSTGASGVPIAIIDSGIDADHPDLAAKLLPGYNFLNGTTVTDDLFGHGTAVAGSAGAIGNNAQGVAGVAWDNPLMPMVVLDTSNYATYANIASAIIRAVDQGARVLNISIGGSSSSITLQNAVNYAWSKGAVIVSSAANYSVSTPYYPAACENVLAISSTDKYDALSSFSNYGNWIDLAAPGSIIYTTNRGGGYGAWNGTSFSSPIVAGLAGLIWSTNPELSNAEVVEILKQGADDLGTAGFDTSFGFGRINVYNSLQLAQSVVPTPDQEAPTVALTSPGDGDGVSGAVVVTANATDNLAVNRVDLLIDGKVFATDESAPHSFSWETASLADGWRTLSAIAYDEAGNVGTSAEIMVLVSNPTQDVEAPTVEILSPYAGDTVAKKVTVNAAANDNVAVTRIDLSVDGKLTKTVYASTLSHILNTARLSAGAHTLSVQAFDAAGNIGEDSVIVYR